MHQKKQTIDSPRLYQDPSNQYKASKPVKALNESDYEQIVKTKILRASGPGPGVNPTAMDNPAPIAYPKRDLSERDMRKDN